METDRRRFDREILDEIKSVHEIVTDIKVTQAVLNTQVNKHLLDSDKLDANTRICSLEQSRKLWRAIVVAIPSFGGLILGLLKIFAVI